MNARLFRGKTARKLLSCILSASILCIVINNNTIQNYTYMGYDGGFGGSTYQIVGPELFNRKQNNADLSNVPTHGQIMDNVTITNTLFRDAAIYEMNGNGKDYNDENRMIIYSDRLIAKVENMYWGSREFTEMMPIADPVSPRINNLEVYSDQAPSAMLVSPESNLSCAPHKIENRYMGPYITIRTLYSVQDLKNIEVYAVPAKGGELAEVKVAVMTNGKYLTAQGEWTEEETFLTAKLAENGNYVLTLKDSVLETLENGMYTLIVYAVGADGTESGRETINYELAVDDSKPLPPTNVEQPTSARTFTTVDITWDAPYDYQSGDTYKVYYGVLNSAGSYLDSLDEELSNQPGFKNPPTRIVRKRRTTSQTDPDSGYINHGSKRGIGYLMEATVDCKHGILTGVDVYPANEKESILVLRHLERQINLGVPMKRLALDRGYETGAVHRGLELLGITGYIPAIQFSNPPEKYGFSYDPQQDAFICPEGVPLTYHRLNCNKSTGKYLRCYQVEGDACMHCSKRPNCFDKAGIRRRVLASSCYPAFFRGHQRVGTLDYLSMMRLRKIWAEGSFSVLKREHCISKIRKRGILAATEECLLAAMALNLKRMVNAIFFYLQFQCSA